jgi:transposase-like protein
MDRVDSIRGKYRRGEPVAAIAREVGVSRDTVYKYARMEDLSPEPPKARRRRPSKMDRWAPARRPVAHRRLQGEQEAEAHRAQGLAPAGC